MTSPKRKRSSNHQIVAMMILDQCIFQCLPFSQETDRRANSTREYQVVCFFLSVKDAPAFLSWTRSCFTAGEGAGTLQQGHLSDKFLQCKRPTWISMDSPRHHSWGDNWIQTGAYTIVSLFDQYWVLHKKSIELKAKTGITH